MRRMFRSEVLEEAIHHELSRFVPTSPMHTALRNRLRNANRTSVPRKPSATAINRLDDQLDRARRLFEYGEYDWDPSARDVTKSPTRSARYAKPWPRASQMIWNGVKRNSSTSRLLGKRRIRASDHGWSQGSSNTSKQRPCPRARCASSQFRVGLGCLSLRGWYWSGRRASNPLPRPWQGRALPSELLPLGQRFDFTRRSGPPTHAGTGARHVLNCRPHLSRSAFTRWAERWRAA